MNVFYIDAHNTEPIINSALTACGSFLVLLQPQAGRHLIIFSEEMAGYPCARTHVMALEHGRVLSKL